MDLEPGISGITLPVIMDGVIIDENLERTPYSKDDILKQLKNKNIENLSDIVIGEVHTNGSIILLKKEYI